MIRVDIDEQDAVSLHDVIERLRRIAPTESDRLRGPALALAGALRAAGWTPADVEGTWEKRAARRRGAHA